MGVADAAEDLPVEADEGEDGDGAGHHQAGPVDVESGEAVEGAESVLLMFFPDKYKLNIPKKINAAILIFTGVYCLVIEMRGESGTVFLCFR